MEENNMIIKRDGANQSIWQFTESIAEIQPPSDKQPYDVVIICGRITGVTTALNLQRSGKRCIIIEAKNLGFGTTIGTSAHLNTLLDATYPEIDSDFGKESSNMLVARTKEIITEIKRNIDTIGIDADFEYLDGYLFSQNQKETEQINEIFSSSKQAGVEVEGSSETGLPIGFKRH